MTGRQRYQRVASSQVSRKEDRPLIFSGVLGLTTNGEHQVDVPGRPGFVWVRLRNQLNETIQAFNETVSQVFDLPVLVEWDKNAPVRYKVLSRDIGRYSSWGSTSSFLPRHGAQHSFNPAIGQTGGDIVWVYSQQFMPLLVTPSGSSGAMSVSVQPASYYYDEQFRWAGGTGIAGFDTLRPTGSSNARMLLIYLDPDSGNVLLATGSLTEFANTITGTAQILPYMPSLIEPTDVPLAGVRLLTGSSSLLWPNIYDLRDYFVHSSVSGSSGGGGGAPDDAQYVTMALDGDLSDERVLTAGADINIDDGGANGNATVSVPTGTFSRASHTHPSTLMTLFTIKGTLAVESNPLRIYNNYGESKTISKVFISVDTAPTDALIIVDVHKDGTTIFTTQGNRPSIAAGANTGDTITIDAPIWADGEYLDIDVDQIGSGTAGANLTVHISHSYSPTLMTIFTSEGDVAVGSNPFRIYNNFGETKTISEVFLSVNTPPTDASIIVDIHKDGTTIFTAQGNRPAIAAGANIGNTLAIDIPSWAVGEYLTMDIDQIGSGTAGSDITVHIIHS